MPGSVADVHRGPTYELQDRRLNEYVVTRRKRFGGGNISPKEAQKPQKNVNDFVSFQDEVADER